MADHVPLGFLAAFSEWDGPRPWGPDDAWTVTFGSGDAVVTNLIKGLAAHPGMVAAKWPKRVGAYPLVVGCTPWLTNLDVVKVLQSMSCCIVIDKKSRDTPAARRLARSEAGLSQAMLGLEDWGPADAEGNPPLIAPWSPDAGSRELETVRMVGFGPGGTDVPLLHVKMAVCCAAWPSDGKLGERSAPLFPLSVWMGSANWTAAAARHIEFGAWSTDTTLCATALDFMRSVVTASEPLTSKAAGPLPELVEGELNEEAFLAYDNIGHEEEPPPPLRDVEQDNDPHDGSPYEWDEDS